MDVERLLSLQCSESTAKPCCACQFSYVGRNSDGDGTGSAWLEHCLFGYCGTNTSFLKLGVCNKSLSKRAYLLKAVLVQTQAKR